MISKKILYIFLSMILAFASSCDNRNDMPEPSQNIINENNKESINSIDISAYLDTNIPVEDIKSSTRSYIGLKNSTNDKLIPNLTNNESNVILVLASKKNNQVHIEEKNWKYDSSTKTLYSASAISKVSGKVNRTPLSTSIPTSLINAGDLRMLLILAPNGYYDAQTKTLKFNNNGQDARGFRLAIKDNNGNIDLKIPYFSNWADVELRGSSISLKEGQSFTFSPKGKVLKFNITNNQDAYSDLNLRGIAMQTNSFSLFGKYDLSSISQATARAGTLPTWIADDQNVRSLLTNAPYKESISRISTSNQTYNVYQSNYAIDLKEDVSLPAKGKTITCYAWVMPLENPYTESDTNKKIQKSVTRFFIRAARAGDREKYPVLKATYSFMPALYSDKYKFTKTGVNINLSIENTMVVSPIEFFADTRIFTKDYRSHGTNTVNAPDKWKVNIKYTNFDYEVTQWATIRFSVKELYDHNPNYYGNNGFSKDGVQWHIPTPDEMRTLIPINAGTSVDNVFNTASASGTKADNISESVTLRITNSEVKNKTYNKSSFYRMPDTKKNSVWEGDVHILALRHFSDGDEEMKTLYTIDIAAKKNRKAFAGQLQYHYLVKAYHLGSKAYPDIKTAQDAYLYLNEIRDKGALSWKGNSRYVHGIKSDQIDGDMVRLHLYKGYEYRKSDKFQGVVATETRAPFTENLTYKLDVNADRNYGVFPIRRSR